MEKNFRREYLNKLESGGRLSEREVLTMLLGNAYGGRDFSAVAQALLARFPSVGAVLRAGKNELTAVEGVTDAVATYLMCVGRVLTEDDDCGEQRIEANGECPEFIKAALGRRNDEFLCFYFVDKSGRIKKTLTFTSGKTEKVDVSAKKIMSVLSADSHYGLYAAHNHVNCSAEPSAADDEMTARLVKACRVCDKVFLDHFIVSSLGECFSYFKSGRLAKLSP